MEVDRNVLAKLSQEFGTKQQAFEEQIHQLAGQPFNIGSPKATGRYSLWQNGSPRRPQDSNRRMVNRFRCADDLAAQGIELAKRVLDWRQLAKLRSTYTEALPNYMNPKDWACPHVLRHGLDVDGASLVH